MTTRLTHSVGDDDELTNKGQLIHYLESGSKPVEDWRVGMENEMFLFRLDTGLPLTYDGGIKPLFEAMMGLGWTSMMDEGALVAVQKDGALLSLEPGLQLELAGRPCKTVHEVHQEVMECLGQIEGIAHTQSFRLLGCGFSPTWTLEQVPRSFFKTRFKILDHYLAQHSPVKGHDMMYRTCGVQANLDFCNQEDMAKKMRVAMALQPVVSALFTNAPFYEGKKGDYLSFRGRTWDNLEAGRAGILSFVFDEGFGFEQYVDYALALPVCFIHRDTYLSGEGATFLEYMTGKKRIAQCTPTIADFVCHLTSLFPEVRLKKVIETRGTDTVSPQHVAALAALWVGLLYDAENLEGLCERIRSWKAADIIQAQSQVAKLGFAAELAGLSVLELAKEVLAMADHGLGRRGQNESVYLKPLLASAQKGLVPAQEALKRYEAGASPLEIYTIPFLHED